MEDNEAKRQAFWSSRVRQNNLCFSQKHHWRFDDPKRAATQSSENVSVFVNFVSKRTYVSSLKKAFSEYGKVVDVCIAYNNLKRRFKSHTFTFVRFSSRTEALKAVELGSFKKIDGFVIKVFLVKSNHKYVLSDPRSNATKVFMAQKPRILKSTWMKRMVDVDSNSEGHALVTGQYSNDHVQVPFTKVDNLQTDFVGPKMGLMDIPITFAIE
ncbi:hypothetical protein V6N11_018952 [Hibiscus sabdariffa]|uniref:RRM domain-containing protein n=1 Tax=Hibiscus sabdariffa TaxID=183260 RepID=A0ABR2R0V3_9ROSI